MGLDGANRANCPRLARKGAAPQLRLQVIRGTCEGGGKEAGKRWQVAYSAGTRWSVTPGFAAHRDELAFLIARKCRTVRVGFDDGKTSNDN